ncbi:hypothetical protein [Streptomyces sp. NPDC027717]|uniref:hypothetical protein n=1 Tax=Streptomyces sp. NPDC027717 TaxID=3155765 RepID=UPI0033C3EE89
MNPDPEQLPSYVIPACARCGNHFQPGEPYDVVRVETGSGVAPDAYRHREPCAPAPRRR